MKIGEKLKMLRQQNQLTQSKLAETLGVSTGAIGLWELDKREPDYDILLKISNLFHVSIDYLLGNDNSNTITIIGRNGSYTSFALTEDKLEAIYHLAETLVSSEEK